ncbi:MAG TPA: DUF4390 domain-containing protein [Gemmatimonadaceae bacterium]|nr:DUF4390 domain-containing protein [Gemmatimonadaceae bacterium]
MLFASGVASQETRPRLDVSLPPARLLTTEGPTIRAVGVVADTAMLVLVRNGFPMQLHYRVELWAARRLFDNVLSVIEWDVVMRYDALNERYRVFRVDSGRVRQLGVFTSVADAAAEVERAIRVPLPVRGPRGRLYYRAVLDVETLSDNDLDEVERWLRGELRPAVRGERNPGTAIGRGVRRVFVKVLGGEQRHLEARTPSFRVQ